MIALELLIAASTLAPSATPEIQRPAAKTAPGATAPAAPADAPTAETEAVAEPTTAPEAVAEPTADDAAGTASEAAEAAPDSAPPPADEPPADEPPAAEAPVAEAPAAEPAPADGGGEVFTVAAGDGGPPFYDASDAAELRQRHGIPEPSADERTEPARWRCLIADPTCGTSFEVNALAAYAYRGRQGSVDGNGDDPRWSSGRAQYDFWMNLPVMTEVAGRTKFTRMTLGPKVGAIFSDTGDTWGNLGVAMRYWFGRGRWAPTLEFSSALAFKVGSRNVKNLGGAEPKWQMERGPVGFTADVGVGLGGFGAIVVGGQYDSPLAREDVPEQFRVSAGGAFFLGFRGNILWGAPAAAAIATHAATQRAVEAP